MVEKTPELEKDLSSRPLDQTRRESVGRLLARTREEYGQDLRGVADALRIRYAYLEAIESGRFDRLPGPAYAVGFVRTYAEFLGLDRETVVERFKQEVDGLNGQTQLHFLTPVPEGKIPGGAVFLVCALVAGMAYGGWYYLSNQGRNVVDLIPEVPANMQALLGQDEPADTPARTAASEPVSAASRETAVANTEAAATSLPSMSQELTRHDVLTARSDPASRMGVAEQADPGQGQTGAVAEEPALASAVEAPSAPEAVGPGEAASGDDQRMTAAEGTTAGIAVVQSAAAQSVTTENMEIEAAESQSVVAATAVSGSGQPAGETIGADAGNDARARSLSSLQAVPPAQPGAGLSATETEEPRTSVIGGNRTPLLTGSDDGQSVSAPDSTHSLAGAQQLPRNQGTAQTPLISLGDDRPAPASDVASLGDTTPVPTIGTAAQAETATPGDGATPVEVDSRVEVVTEAESPAQTDQSMNQVMETVAAIPAVPSSTSEVVSYSDERAPITYGETNAAARVVLRAAQDCWVQVRDPNGALLLTRVLRKGDSYKVPNRRNLTLLTGNAGGLWIEVDGIRLAPLGPVGAVRRDVSLDPERLLSGTALNQ